MTLSNLPATGLAVALAGSVIVASTPARTERAPGTRASTPARTERAPGTRASTPARTERAPGTRAQTPGYRTPAATGPAAYANIKGEGISGSVTLTQRKQGTGVVVAYTIQVKGLKPGLHGVHLHAVGKCEPDFDAAGGHFDPGPAGNPDPDANHPFHLGDIPNLEAGADGVAMVQGVTTRVTLSDGPLSLFDADGSAIIVHGNPDQGITGAPESGVSGGPRVACGVVTKK